MNGSISGDFLGILYMLIYQVVGILFAGLFFRKENKTFQLLLGSITGTVAMHWFPILVSFAMGFSVTSHLIGLALFIILMGVIRFTSLRVKVFGSKDIERSGLAKSLTRFSIEVRENPFTWICIILLFIFFSVLLASHTIPFGKNGEIRTGQCTFGDMNMHLGFITSITKQSSSFPPDYSILPGTKLCYPFLCDSISSSIYVFGSSLSVAYNAPMLIAIFQVMLGFFTFANCILKNKHKSLLAWVLFFFNGGLGFWYFFDFATNPEKAKFASIFTGFYTTPTNYLDGNLRWSNTIVDMLLPQRATLFGWAVLFGTLALLYKAVKSENVRYFVLAALFGGALPLIHTHSFLALAIICVVWVIGYMYKMIGGDDEKENKIAKFIIPGGLVIMPLIQASLDNNDDIGKAGIAIVIAVVLCMASIILFYVYKVVKAKKFNELMKTWGVFLLIVLVLALPQLINWTFKQVGGSSESLRGHFNWANENDNYLWFYIKNIGLVSIISIPALIYSKRKRFFTFAPALLTFAICEFMVFQPNVYDNNKLLYIAYALLAIASADYLGDLIKRVWDSKKKVGSVVLTACLLFVATASGILTMGREYTSGKEYELYSADDVALCNYIEENVPAESIILTDTRHNNAVPSITGRNIVCGAGTFLFFHGLNYGQQDADVKTMYMNPSNNAELFKKYNVSYIVIGPSERSTYQGLDENALSSMGECVFKKNNVALYKIK